MQLITILLQADVTSPTILTRIFDSAISLGILAVIAKVLWGKVTKVENKMETYMQEDRATMYKVIDRNTKVMERLEEHLEEEKRNK